MESQQAPEHVSRAQFDQVMRDMTSQLATALAERDQQLEGLRVLLRARDEAVVPPEAAVVEPLRPPQNNPLPMGLKVDLSRKFSKGRKLAREFLVAVEFHSQARNFEHCILSLIPIILEGDALAWWCSLMKDGACPVTWDEFCVIFMRRFGDPNEAKNARDALHKIPQGSVENVRAALERLLPMLPDLSEADRIYHFSSRLVGPARYKLEQESPSSLSEAIGMAETAERAAAIAGGAGSSHPQVNRYGSGSRGQGQWCTPQPVTEFTNGPVPMELGAMQQQQLRIAPLTAAEREALRSQDGCFYCRKPHAGHYSDQCPRRRTGPGSGRGRGH